MIKSNRYTIIRIVVFSFFPVILYSCQPGGSSPRKKMPELNGTEEFEGGMPFSNGPERMATGDFAFSTSNVDLQLNGSTQGFVSVPLPDAANDSLAISLVNSFKPFAMPLLAAWAQQQRNGVVIDLGSHTSAVHNRSDFALRIPGNLTIPVVVMWDHVSAGRVKTLKRMVEDMPLVELTQTN
ncbi:MAG TPA: hypothetical protein VGC08_03650 [Pedobacter sp.]